MHRSLVLLAFAGSAPLLLAQSAAPAPAPQDPPPNPTASPAEETQEPRAPVTRVVVTASGFREEELRTPYTFHTLDQRQMLERGSRTLPEALRQTPGIMIQKTAHGHGSPFIRGFTGQQNLLMIDGIRFNNSTFRSGPVQYWNTIDAFAIDHLEIVKSQGSVLYGSDAVGGTVNVMTRSADFRAESDGELFQHGSAFYRFETNSLSHTGRLESQVGEGGAYGLHVGATYRDFGDIRDSEVGRMRKTGYDEFDYDLRYDVAASDTATLTLAHQSVTQDDIWRTHRTIYFEPWHGTTLSSPDLARIYDQDRSLTYLRLSDQDLVGALSSYSMTVSYQHFEEDFVRTRTSGANLRDEIDRTVVDTFGAALALESDVLGGKLVYGADYYQDSVGSTSRDVRTDPNGVVVRDTLAVQGPVGDDARYDLFGVYAQYRTPVTPELELTLGGRYTYAAADIDVLDDGAGNPIAADRNWDDATFNVRASYRVDESTSVYGGASQAFRAPNINDLSSLKSSRTNEISTGSLDIDPEHFLTYELGTRHRSPDLAVDGAVYYTDMRDVITSRPVGTVPGSGETITATTNGSDGYLYGGELEASYRVDDTWTASGQVAYVDGKADTFPTSSLAPVREPISRLMPWTGSVALRWQPPQSRLWCGARVTAVAHAGRLNSGDRSDTSRIPPDGTPGYVHVLLDSGFQATDHLELFLAVDNATDIDYRVHGSGLNEPGINVIVGGRLGW